MTAYEAPKLLFTAADTPDILEASGEAVEDLTANDTFDEAYGDHFS